MGEAFECSPEWRRRKRAADMASAIMVTISPRGPGSLDNERWNLGHKLITAALLETEGEAAALDDRDLCACRIGQCRFLTERCREVEAPAAEEARSWRAVAERLETEMQALLHACECEIRDQTHNRGTSDKRSAAYAEGALRVAKGIAARIKAGAAAR